MSLTTAKFEDEWCRFIRFRKRMLSILDAESSKDELTISEHDQFGKEYEELSAHMLKLLGSIAADRFGYVSPNNGPGPAERRITCSPIRKQNI